MKKIWLLTTLLISGLLLTGCNTNEKKAIEQNSSILTWGFCINSDMDTKKDEKTDFVDCVGVLLYTFFFISTLENFLS